MTGVSMTLPQLHRRECTVDGQVVRLTPSMAELLSLLLVSHPSDFVDWAAIGDALWPGMTRQPDLWRNVIKVYLSRLRGLGIGIDRRWRAGWRIPRECRVQTVAQPQRLAA
jgi:DNA-binding response OmpR family regulator